MTKLFETNPNEYYERLKQWATELGLETENIKREPPKLIRTQYGHYLYRYSQYLRNDEGELVVDADALEAVYDTVHVRITIGQAQEAYELGLVADPA